MIQARRPTVVVVGTGMAGGQVVEEILARTPDQFHLRLFGDEPHGTYNRILLSSVLGGFADPAQLWLRNLDWYRDRGVLVHAGVHFNGALAWLAVLAMLANVTSGLTGKYLLQRVQRSLREQKAGLLDRGATDAEIEERLYWDSLAFDLVRQWRKVHVGVATSFAVLATAHVIAVFLFWGWR